MLSGGVSPVQVVNSPATGSSSTCLRTAEANSTLRFFTFNVSGSTAECESGFRLTWDGPVSQGPYNFSVIPLDGGYLPWVVPLNSSTNHYDWQVNMTRDTYFTIMMK